MTISEINILHEKAKTKKDGIYSYRNNYYAVKNGRFIAYANFMGECFQRMGAFNAVIGKVDHYDRKNKLKEWLKSQK